MAVCTLIAIIPSQFVFATVYPEMRLDEPRLAKVPSCPAKRKLFLVLQNSQVRRRVFMLFLTTVLLGDAGLNF